MKKKKLIIIVIIVVIMGIIGAYLVNGIGKSSSSKKNVEKFDSKKIVEKVDSKKIVKKTDIKAGSKENTNEIVLKNTASQDDVAKFINDYLSKVVSDSNDKVIKSSFVQNDKQIQNATVYKDLKNSNGIKYSLRIQSGFLPINRFVEVIVDTNNPSKNAVSILGKSMKYSSEEKVFYTVVNSSDEQKIKDNIIIK